MNITKEQIETIRIRSTDTTRTDCFEMGCVFETIQRKIANGTLTVTE